MNVERPLEKPLTQKQYVMHRIFNKHRWTPVGRDEYHDGLCFVRIEFQCRICGEYKSGIYTLTTCKDSVWELRKEEL